MSLHDEVGYALIGIGWIGMLLAAMIIRLEGWDGKAS